LNRIYPFPFLALPLFFAVGCAQPPPVTSDILNQNAIQAIRERLEQAHSGLSAEKARKVVELVVHARENMVQVEGGTFQMGDWLIECQWDKSQGCRMDSNPDNDHVHEVKLSSFGISRYETTLGDFDLFRELQGKEPYRAEWRQSDKLADMFHPRKPAWTKDWQETQDYCQWVGKLAGVEMDLPTEAQWEYAARSRGRWLIWATDNGEIDSGRNFPRDGEGFGETQNVGSYPPNPLGVYDMAANSKEWVADWHSETYYAESPAKDPNGPSSGNEKVLRGGFNGVSPTSSFTVSRMGLPPQRNEYTRLLSFRCAARTTR
jgi:formylglycine-generating enzyme required for sulfatase activity